MVRDPITGIFWIHKKQIIGNIPTTYSYSIGAVSGGLVTNTNFDPLNATNSTAYPY